MARIQGSLKVVRLVRREGSSSALLALENRTPRPLYFTGYSFEQPRYAVLEEQAGEWKRIGGWCGTGMREVELPPDGRTTFDVPLGASARRVSVTLRARLQAQWERLDELFAGSEVRVDLPARGADAAWGPHSS